MIRPAARVTNRTIDQTLPRLRLWRTWVPGYMDELSEMGRVATTAMDIHSLTSELHTRLMTALATLTLTQVALGCEVPLSRLAAWIAGQYTQADLPLMMKALAHLRHVSSWPAAPRARTDSYDPDDQHLAGGRGQGA